MNKWIFIGMGIIILSVVGIFFLRDSSVTGNTVIDGDSQDITLSYSSWNYALSDNTVNAGEPVTITVDTSTVKGCYKSVSIPQLGISKYVREGDNQITFTPTKPGVYTIRCSMGMATTKLTVV
ncbi:cupredoxin domain-containing protein [Candidatus Woesearchaeota archaeon]|nr:cupredoxin domain-containing protein [Candidatus Woesearchaeota archaeon]